MYKVSEKPMDKLLLEGTALLSKLSNNRDSDVMQFGNALLSVQTEVQQQKKPNDVFGND